MLDKDDIQKLIEAQKEVFVTKGDLEGLIDIITTKQEMRDGFEKISNKLDKVEDQEIKPLKERIRKVENALAIE